MAKDWPVIISGLQSLLSKTGPIWPGSKLAGFASGGPFHCADCGYLKDSRCNQEVMMADPEVQHDGSGLAIISDPEHQCCEFVEPVNKSAQVAPQQGQKLVAIFVRHGQTEANKEKRFRGALNIPLDNVGRQQALDARGFLAGFLGGQPLGAAYRSNKDRTAETSHLVLGAGKVQVVKNLDALNVGKFSGQLKNDENMKEILHYQKNPDQKIPGGERINDFRARVNPELSAAIKEGDESGRPTILFVHSSTIHQLSHFLHGDHNLVKVKPGGIVGVYKRPNGGYYVKALLHESGGQQDHLMS